VSGILLEIALRNLRLHWVRTLIVGALLTTGTWLVVVGQAALDSIQVGMRRSVVDTISGHLQLYSSNAKDPLELIQSAALAVPDLGQIDDYSKVRDALAKLPEVDATIPMGLGRSVVWGESTVETKLEELRRAITDGDKDRVVPLVAHVRQICRSLVGELDKLSKVAADTKEAAEQRADLDRANSDAFWAEFDKAPLDALEFLDNRIAPLGLQTGMFFFNYIGTDIPAFSGNFKLFRLQSGEMPKSGERGFLFNSNFYEKFVKHRTARRLDQIKEARDLDGRLIATDDELKREVERNLQQVTQITDQLDPQEAERVRVVLQAELATKETDLQKLVASFLTVDDANFDRRYKVFYDDIAPVIRLYAYMVGDTISLYGQTKSGYPRAVNVKVKGVFRYEGLEKSGLAGIFNLMDLMTFRDLNGLSDPIRPEELAAIKTRAGIKDIKREEAEDALFGGDNQIVAEVDNQAFDPLAGNDLAGLRRAALAAQNAPFTQAELEAGPAINAAVFLKDPETALEDLGPILTKVSDTLKAAGLPVMAVPWNVAQGQAVSGLSAGINFFFFILVGIIFFVALIVIVNSLLMSTMERVQEIGTIRAMGAQRSYVVRMFAIEAAAMALIFGLVGIGLGALTVAITGAQGIPATSEILFFVFGGRSLAPRLAPEHLAIAAGIIAVVTLVASLIPAFVASRIPPIAAMQAKE
jgi:ABC-type lipoprotein release transport system permease subunit